VQGKEEIMKNRLALVAVLALPLLAACSNAPDVTRRTTTTTTRTYAPPPAPVYSPNVIEQRSTTTTRVIE
jgi:hypothetical protein